MNALEICKELAGKTVKLTTVSGVTLKVVLKSLTLRTFKVNGQQVQMPCAFITDAGQFDIDDIRGISVV
jgi:hypothetical protein